MQHRALAVAHLHRNGILHRDLSSNNILLNAVCIASLVVQLVSVRLRELARDHDEQLKLNPTHQLVALRMHLLTRARHSAPRGFALQC